MFINLIFKYIFPYFYIYIFYFTSSCLPCCFVLSRYDIHMYQLAHKLRKNTPSIKGMDHSTKQLKRPDSNITNRTSSECLKKLFYCGYPLQSLQPLFFPDFSSGGIYLPGQNSSGVDIILYGMHGGCRATYEHIEQSFKGKAILVNGESNGNIVTDFPHLKKIYQLGSLAVDADGTMKVYMQ